MIGRVALAVTVLALAGGCATSPPAVPPEVRPAVWGDEYEGIQLDADRDFANAIPASFGADVVAGESVSTRLRAGYGPVSVRYRATGDGSAGAGEWRGGGVEAVAGSIRPAVAEGAVVADARDTGAPAPRSLAAGGLRLTPSASTWGSVTGGGVGVRVKRVRVAAAAWRTRDADPDTVVWVSGECHSNHSVAGVSAGGSAAGGRGASLFAAHTNGSLGVSCETGAGRGGLRSVARVTAGEHGEWRGVVAGGETGVSDPTASPGRQRWGAAIERRDTRGAMSSRLTLSSSTRRDADGDDRRRRLEWAGAKRIGEGARVDVNLRATRDDSRRAPSLLEDAVAPPARDDLRARIALHTRDRPGVSTTVEFVYRADAVSRGDGSGTGVVLLWQGRVRHRGVDLRVQASAFDLPGGVVGYIGRAVLPGAATFTALARRGADLSASLRATWRFGLSVGLQWAARPPARGVLVVQAALRP